MDISKNPRHIASLQIVRTMAFLGVFLYHAIRTFPGKGSIYDYFADSLGLWGVSVFFVLSGFLMTYSYWNSPPESSLKFSFLFSIKKIKKLYPLHLLMLLAGVLYLLLTHEATTGLLKQLAITIPLIQTWFPEDYMAINSVAWYLSVCVFLYFCFPFLLERIKKNNRKWRSFAVISGIFGIRILIGYILFRYTEIDMKWITYIHPVSRLGDFAIGGFLASVYLKRKPHTEPKRTDSMFWRSVPEVVAIALNVMACVFFMNTTKSSRWFSFTSLFVLPAAALIYAFSLNNGIISKALTNKATFWLAAISPYAFLVHRIVIKYFYYFTTDIFHCKQVSFIFVILIPFVITVAIVYLYRALEKAVTAVIRKNK